jgi:hypothetical protein
LNLVWKRWKEGGKQKKWAVVVEEARDLRWRPSLGLEGTEC